MSSVPVGFSSIWRSASPTSLKTRVLCLLGYVLGAGLLISEATAISEQGYGWCEAPGCYTAEQAAAWKPVTEA
jgi:hypothetical protein